MILSSICSSAASSSRMTLPWLQALRRQIFLLASLAFVGLFYFAAMTGAKANPGWLVFLAACVAVHFLLLQVMLLMRWSALRSALYYLWLAGLILTFLVVKQYTWITAWILPGAEQLLARVNLAACAPRRRLAAGRHAGAVVPDLPPDPHGHRGPRRRADAVRRAGLLELRVRLLDLQRRADPALRAVLRRSSTPWRRSATRPARTTCSAA